METPSEPQVNLAYSDSAVQPAPTSVRPKRQNPAAIAVAVVAALGIGYFVYAYVTESGPFASRESVVMESPSPSPAGSVDPMAGWKTHTNQSTDFSFQHPADMAAEENDQPYPGDPTKRWVFLTLESAPLNGSIVINNPGSGAAQVESPVVEGSVTTASGAAITYSTGLESHEMDSRPAGPERIWTGGISVGGNDFNFVFRSANGTDRTEMVERILSTFQFGVRASKLESINATWNLYTTYELGFSMWIPKSTRGGSVVSNEEPGSVRLINEQGTGWSISSSKVRSVAELGTFVAQNPSWVHCDVEQVTAIEGKDYSRVLLRDDRSETSQCFLNYVYVIFYSPKAQKAVYWTLGQDVSFTSPDLRTAYDEDMVNSFRFLE